MRFPTSIRLVSTSLTRTDKISAAYNTLFYRMASTSNAVSDFAGTDIIYELAHAHFVPRPKFGLKDSSLIKTQGFIDGKWVDAKDGARITITSKHNSWLRQRHVHEVFRLLDPANDKELGTVPEMGVTENK